MGYIITTLDEKTQEMYQQQQGLTELFTNGKDPIFYFYNRNIKNKNGKKISCHVYIISPETLIKDAFARNNTFLNILKGLPDSKKEAK